MPTRTFTPTVTATLTDTPTPEPGPTATSTAQPATLPPRPTEPSLTPTEIDVNPNARQQSTAIPYAWTIYPTRFGGLGNGGRVLVGIVGALIVIGILWFSARAFADGSVRQNFPMQTGGTPGSASAAETDRASRYQEAVRRWIREGWNKGNFEVVERLFDPNFHLKDFSNPDARPYTGHIRLKRYVLRFRKAFPDLQITDDDIFVAGSQVVWRFVATGTHQGRFLGLHPTGKAFKVKGVAIFEFSGDLVQECSSYWNSFNLLHQIAGDLSPQEIFSAMQKFRY